MLSAQEQCKTERGRDPIKQFAEETKPTNGIYRLMVEQNEEEKILLSYKPSPLEAFTKWAELIKKKIGEGTET